LRPLPEKPYEYAERKVATVNIDYHVEFENHLYSVPYTLIHEKVDIRATERMVEIFHQGKLVSIHPRNFRPGRFSTLREHMPANHQFMEDINSDRLIEWASRIGPKTAALVKATLQSRPYPEQAYRTCLGILSLGKKYNQTMLEQACQVALAAKVFSYGAVEQELAYLHKQTAPAPVETLPTHENIRGPEYYQERPLP
jgi:hypothetical protein